MTWASGWAASLAQGHASLKVLIGPLGAPAVTITDDEMQQPVVAAGGGLRLRVWQTSIPQLRVRMAGTPLRLAEVRAVAPGATVQLQVSTSAGTERVFAGRLRESLTPQPGVLELVVDSAETWAQSRYEATDWRPGLWDGLTGEEVTTATFTPGDTTLYAPIPALPFTPGPGSSQYVLIYVDVGGGYWLAADTHAVGYVSGVVMLQWTGSAPVSAPIGTTVRYGPLVVGSPLDVLLRVLISSGAATGGYDALPDGLAIPATLIDTADAAALASCVGAAGVVDRYTFGTTSPQREPEGGDLLAWAAYLGLWLCQRQGALTVRAAVSPHDSAAWSALYVGDVTDDLLMEVGAHTTRAPDAIPEYVGADLWMAAPRLLVPDGEVGYSNVPDPLRATTNPTTQPVGSSRVEVGYSLEVAAIAWLDISNLAAYTDDLQTRLAPWWGRRCEAVEVVLGGEAMGWALGDLVSVTSAAIPGPVADGGVAVGRRALWAPSAWDWTARQVAGTLYLLADG